MTYPINFLPEKEDKPYIHTTGHNNEGIFNNNINDRHFPKCCWKCKTSLIVRRLWDGQHGLYCVRCCRFRKLRVDLKGVSLWSRVDVRRSGKLKRKVFLDEEL